MNLKQKECTDFEMSVDGIPVLVTHRSVSKPSLAVCVGGKVKVTLPRSRTYSTDKVRELVISRLSWIKQATSSLAEAEPKKEMVNGELHYLFGEPYKLDIIEKKGNNHVAMESGILRMTVKPGTSKDVRAKLLNEWHRERLTAKASGLLNYWQRAIGQTPNSWGIRKMRRKWGLCDYDNRRIALNLLLARSPEECLEYVIVHELCHLIEPNHSNRFWSHVEKHLLDWRERENKLNKWPLEEPW